ncbi:hypothetical protein QJS04_geneDACA001088 [Acorus gramineus]|uniref:WRC domain-containing protein n=1 Tax=Acorus gramineus TaxID=55184 RepID=A0AAV9AB24_ACOGR|nr:hypothetical protein QJS04_geneDACA001088 [Acorus gramineus]
MELEETPPVVDNRCMKNNGGRSWRCKNHRMPGKCLCQKHYLSIVRYQRRNLPLPPPPSDQDPQTPDDVGGASIDGPGFPPDEQRCVKTNGGKYWRCKNDRLPGKSFCGRHSFRRSRPMTKAALVGRVSVKVGTDEGDAVIVPEADWTGEGGDGGGGGEGSGFQRVEKLRVSRKRKVAEGSESPAPQKGRSKLRVSRKKAMEGVDGVLDPEMGGSEVLRVSVDEANEASVSIADGDFGAEVMEDGMSDAVDLDGLESVGVLEGTMHDLYGSAGVVDEGDCTVGRFDDALDFEMTAPPIETTMACWTRHSIKYTHQSSSTATPALTPCLMLVVLSAHLLLSEVKLSGGYNSNVLWSEQFVGGFEEAQRQK